MDYEEERKLKELYRKIERGRSITLNELVFLSEYDVDCFARTYKALVLDGPKEKKEAEITKPVFTPGMISMTAQQHVDEIISILRSVHVTEDLLDGVKPQDVAELVREEHAVEPAENDRYEYYSSYEPKTYLNARA